MTVAESRQSITTVQKAAGQSEASVLANSLVGVGGEGGRWFRL